MLSHDHEDRRHINVINLILDTLNREGMNSYTSSLFLFGGENCIRFYPVLCSFEHWGKGHLFGNFLFGVGNENRGESMPRPGTT